MEIKTRDELERSTIWSLREQARKLGHTSVLTLKKAELVDYIFSKQDPSASDISSAPQLHEPQQPQQVVDIPEDLQKKRASRPYKPDIENIMGVKPTEMSMSQVSMQQMQQMPRPVPPSQPTMVAEMQRPPVAQPVMTPPTMPPVTPVMQAQPAMPVQPVMPPVQPRMPQLGAMQPVQSPYAPQQRAPQYMQQQHAAAPHQPMYNNQQAPNQHSQYPQQPRQQSPYPPVQQHASYAPQQAGAQYPHSTYPNNQMPQQNQYVQQTHQNPQQGTYPHQQHGYQQTHQNAPQRTPYPVNPNSPQMNKAVPQQGYNQNIGVPPQQPRYNAPPQQRPPVQRQYEPKPPINEAQRRPGPYDYRAQQEQRPNQPVQDHFRQLPQQPPVVDEPETLEVRSGILELCPDGFGFLRAENYQQGDRDAYIASTKIRKYGLRKGDYVVAQVKKTTDNRPWSVVEIESINELPPASAATRKNFDALTPIYPDSRLRLEIPNTKNDFAIRAIDLVSPIGKGQRGMIVSPPKAGKTTLLKKIAHSISFNYPEAHLIVLLIDERPEEVTDMQRSIKGEVVYSTFDELADHHTKAAEMVLERAKRLTELGKDVVILMDSLTRLARAYNLVITPTGKTLSGGIDPGALHNPKRFFGAARNIENGGSLTIIATALVDTGSRMDDVIYEEFKGTGNMEIHLDRKLSEKRIFPAIDLNRSGTRREELLLDQQELEGIWAVRKMLSSGEQQDATESLISMLVKSNNNAEFIDYLSNIVNKLQKEGFTMR
ncbi:MAG: transcription termination factor Rho [Christensenellaceae bacterium]|jgi:transcription termination factor Rho|nr:transcription termination factor Rho [Christensenellaceae bacterium]